MNDVMDAPSLATILAATLLIAGATMTLIGSFGLLRFRGFYQRVHAPRSERRSGQSLSRRRR